MDILFSPAYPHPMADNLKMFDINWYENFVFSFSFKKLLLLLLLLLFLEADPSMFIELSPIQIHLQRCN